MSGASVPDDEMPTFRFPHRSSSSSEDELVDRLLDGHPLPSDASAGDRLLAEVLDAAARPASTAELADEQQARLMFRAAVGAAGSSALRPASVRRKKMLPQLLTAKLAAAIAAGTVTLGGTAAAAYATALPAPLQSFAHETIGAPAPSTQSTLTTDTNGTAGSDDASPSPSSSPSPSQSPSPSDSPNPQATPTPGAHGVGPDATGPAAYGLCTAFAAAQANGSVPSGSVAFRNLAAAAGGADKIATYCAGIAHPGAHHPSGTPTTAPSPLASAADKHAGKHATGKPTSLPSQANEHATNHPTGKPTSLPSQANEHATNHPTGKPTSLPSPAQGHGNAASLAS